MAEHPRFYILRIDAEAYDHIWKRVLLFKRLENPSNPLSS